MEIHERVAAYVNLDAILWNLEAMHRAVSPETELIAVIKTDGYGHGAVEIAHTAESLDYLWGFAVATAEEALELRGAGVKKPILILGYVFPSAYRDLIKNDIHMAVFRLDQGRELSTEAAKLNKTAFCHLAVDTGMSRIGVRPDKSSVSLVKELFSLPNIEASGIFTHFAKADEEDRSPTDLQLKAFLDYIGLLETEGIKFKYHHASNSAGIVLFPGANLDIARAGITLYGLMPSSYVYDRLNSADSVEGGYVPLSSFRFKSALELKSHIVYIKYIEPGEAVSYGGTFKAEKRMRVATIPVGYGDGYPRSLSNKGCVLIRGKRSPILGRVCMDQFMVDVTDIPEAAEGDRVTLIGTDGGDRLSMEELGDISGRFNYELACDLGRRIPRIFIKDGKTSSIRTFLTK